MTQEQPYDVLSSFRDFEVRRYPAHLVAEVGVDASFTRAGNEAFGVLVAYISGRNSTRGKVAMTAPVLQEQASAAIEMTSPVVQQPGGKSGRHVVAFVMPAEFTLDTLPTPADPRINVREVPAHVAAVRSFTGRWTEHVYELQLNELRGAVEQAGLEVSGPPLFARFDPPWTPWFRRRNEVVLPVGWNPPTRRDAKTTPR
ncbi:SOUL family heme-binding protein [Tessaracoccus flavus]|uniref:Heme-binding protein n=1 Tax=Tessaracoccus flavus TaxID=1610493 RepID=A0A1Q2CEV0_9ACTN|nr:heme-binding protein [Tessaracoccus flavus]AQP44649.1 heme-binding protein [Tessaracoccus flavus]SDZ18323.1 SOUL heme-binding protein [Tessaracoccus flavus]